MNRARNTDQVARTCERFAYSIVTITRFHDYQTWPTHFFDKCTRCAKVYGLSFLDCAFQGLIGWARKLQSHGCSFEEKGRWEPVLEQGIAVSTCSVNNCKLFCHTRVLCLLRLMFVELCKKGSFIAAGVITGNRLRFSLKE